MILNVSGMDFVFLSVDEPNAEKNFADLKRKVPWAKRVHGVKGFDTAHKKAAEVSDTDRFITVDADTQVHNSFLNVMVDLNSLGLDNTYQLSWCGHIDLNGLRYGNGSLKCWTKDFVKNMRTHENHDGEADSNNKNVIEFCHFPNYYQFNDNYSISYIDGSAHQAWRAGFREGVKMSLNRGKRVQDINTEIWIKNLQKLLIWMNVGTDVEHGWWSCFGARHGCYLTMCTDWDTNKTRDFAHLDELWNEVEQSNVEQLMKHYSESLIDVGVNIGMTPLEPQQSKWFKQVYVNSPRRFK